MTLGKTLPHSGPQVPHIYSELMGLDDLYCPSSLISHDCLCLKRPLAEEADMGGLMVSSEPQVQNLGEVSFLRAQGRAFPRLHSHCVTCRGTWFTWGRKPRHALLWVWHHGTKGLHKGGRGGGLLSP